MLVCLVAHGWLSAHHCLPMIDVDVHSSLALLKHIAGEMNNYEVHIHIYTMTRYDILDHDEH